MIVEIGDFGAEEIIAMYVALCSDMGLSSDQMKFAALELIDVAVSDETHTAALEVFH